METFSKNDGSSILPSSLFDTWHLTELFYENENGQTLASYAYKARNSSLMLYYCENDGKPHRNYWSIDSKRYAPERCVTHPRCPWPNIVYSEPDTNYNVHYCPYKVPWIDWYYLKPHGPDSDYGPPIGDIWGMKCTESGHEHFCSQQFPCNENEGDCDFDDHCIGDLICGSNNCANSSGDCCTKSK